MLLNEIVTLNESVLDLCAKLRTMYDSGDTDQVTAAQYLGYLLVYRDVDNGLAENPLPNEHLFTPGTDTATKAIQFFANKCMEHNKKLVKMAEEEADKCLIPISGEKYFNYRMKEVETYFRKIEPK